MKREVLNNGVIINVNERTAYFINSSYSYEAVIQFKEMRENISYGRNQFSSIDCLIFADGIGYKLCVDKTFHLFACGANVDPRALAEQFVPNEWKNNCVGNSCGIYYTEKGNLVAFDYNGGYDREFIL